MAHYKRGYDKRKGGHCQMCKPFKGYNGNACLGSKHHQEKKQAENAKEQLKDFFKG